MVVAIATAVLAVQAAAQAPTRQELNPGARSQPTRPTPDLLGAPNPGACPLAVNPAPLTVTSVTLRGLESAPLEALRPAYADLLGKAGDAADLCRIRDRVAEALFDRGLLVRVEIPAQTITDGAVTLEVIEAHIVNVTVRGDPGAAGPALERYARKLRGMAPFDVNKVQRYVLLASDVPGLKVRASVRPNPGGARGAVDLDLSVERNAQDLRFNVQNKQARATGRWGGLARYDLNAQDGFGDQVSLIAYRTIRNEQWVAQVLQEGRLGGEGWVIRSSLAYGESHPGDSLKALGLKSKSIVGNLEVAYPLLRARRENLWLSAGVEAINQDTSAGSPLIKDDLRIVYAQAKGDKTFYQWGRPMLLSGQLSLRQGLAGFGATKRGDRLLSRSEARPDAWVLTGSATFLTNLTPKISLKADINAQYADQPLAAYEEYAVGPFTIGRGYDAAYTSGDQALAASLELRGGPYQPRPGLLVSPYGFFDIAHTRDRDTGGFNQTVTSVGAGVQIPVRDRWLLDVMFAQPLDRRALDRKAPSGRLLVSLTTRFF